MARGGRDFGAGGGEGRELRLVVQVSEDKFAGKVASFQLTQRVRVFLSGEVCFDAVFDVLYPPMMIGDSHGLSIQLEAQPLHPEFVDHAIELPVAAIEVADFYDADRQRAA